MNLESSLNELLPTLLSNRSNVPITARQLIQVLDLTLLDEQATEEALQQLNQDAQNNQVAAICVYSQHLATCSQLDTIQRATVINFPHGNESLKTCIESIERAADLGATEIDYVFPYRLYLDGHENAALSQCQAIITQCKQQQLTTKIILETGFFSELEPIYEISNQLIELGCDFLKTSTGKIPQGASLAAVFTMLSAIKDSGAHSGLKVSGGIKKPEQALHYAKLAELMLGKKINKDWFRIGASSLLNELLN